MKYPKLGEAIWRVSPGGEGEGCGGQYHVCIEVQRDACGLVRVERGNPVLTTDETVLLCGPESEANSVLDAPLWQLQGDLEEPHGAGAIVIDSLIREMK